MRVLTRFLPAGLKYRLFLSFLALILLPFFLVQIRSYNQMERLYEHRIAEQSAYQLDQISGQFDQVKTNILMTSLQLEKEPEIVRTLSLETAPTTENGNAPAAADTVSILLKETKTSLRADGAFVQYVLLGPKGTITASFDAGSASGGFHAATFLESAGDWMSRTGKPLLEWQVTPNYLNVRDSGNRDLMTLFSRLENAKGEPIGLLAISFDYRKWLTDQTGRFIIQQDYVLLSGSGSILFHTRPGGELSESVRDWISASRSDSERKPLVDRDTSSIFTLSGIDSLGWVLVAQFPLELFFGDIGSVQRQAYLTFGLFTLLFIAITFLISSAVTRPLRLLRSKMSGLAGTEFRAYLPPDKYRGEMLEIAEAFNQMVRDLNQSVNQLKIEERRREATRFQNLMQQMNPHFLLNTLNAIKWNAYAKGDSSTGELCVALGQLLESSLNLEEELIYFERELELVNAYAQIQHYRYGEKFQIRHEFDPLLRHALVPKFSLQPLVENAILHGFSDLREGGLIVIRARKEGRQLVVDIVDNGTGLKPEERKPGPPKRRSIGLTNIRERLQLLFRTDGGLELVPLEKGTRATMKVPYLISTPYEGGIPHVESASG